MAKSICMPGMRKNYADGGIVTPAPTPSPYSIRGLSSAIGGGIDSIKQRFSPPPGYTPAVQQAPVAPVTAPAVSAPTVPAGSISGYSGMRAMQEREKAAGLKDGGMVKGPGGPVDDRVPIMASANEAVLPADTVEAIGGEPVIKQLIAATHVPASQQRKGAIRAYADGGMVDDRERARQARIAQIPTDITNTAGQNLNVPAANRVDSTEFSRNASAVLNSVPALSGLATGARLAQSGAGTIRALASGGPTAAAAAAPALAPSLPLAVAPVVAGGAVLNAASGPSAEPAMASASPAVPAAAVTRAAAAPPAAAPAAEGTIAFDPKTNTYSGTNVPANTAVTSGRKTNGKISDRNMAAADTLAERSGAEITAMAARMIAAEQAQQYGDGAPAVITRVGRLGEKSPDQQEREALANTAATGRWSVDRSNASRRLSDMDANIAANRRATEQNATTMATAGAQNEVARGRLDVERATARGDIASKAAEVRNKERLDAAQARVLAAKTPAERTKAEDDLRALQGKYERETPNRFTVVPGGSDEFGNRQPSMVLNNQTGEFVTPGAKPAAAPLPPRDKLVKGTIYQTSRGPARWDGANFTPA